MKINEISENISHTSKRLRDIEREKKVKPGTDDWFKLWFSLPYLKESSGNSYMLQLERDNRAGMLVLHILNKQTGKRTEVRGKLGYETNGYDPEDKLHQLLDKIGKSASVSDLMNGDVVSINPRHPQGPAALKVAHDLTNEAKENIYDILEPEDCGPFDGGCVLVAQALQKIHGGDIVVLINDRGNADHAAVKLGNTLIDYDGPLPVEKFIKRFEKNEHVKIKGIRPMKDSDLPEATRNQSLLPKIVNLLSDNINESNPFTDARMNAIKAGKKEFKVGGKTYKVTGDIKDELEAGTNEARTFAPQQTPMQDLVNSYLFFTSFGQMGTSDGAKSPDSAEKIKEVVRALSQSHKNLQNLDKQTLEKNKNKILTHVHDMMNYAIAHFKEHLTPDNFQAKRKQINDILTKYNNLSSTNENVADSTNAKAAIAKISESLDQPYPYSWGVQSEDEWAARARTESGAILDIRFEYGSWDAEWDIEFLLDGGYKATAAGDQFRIFATVVKAIKEWWKLTSAEGIPVNTIRFSADKLNKQTGKTGSRERLYSRFAQQFANSIGFTVQSRDKISATDFELINPNYSKSTNENVADGKVRYAKPQFDVEWEEAERYPEFVKIGKAAWIELANKGKAVTIKSAKGINNTDAADADSFKSLDKDKQARALAQLKSGDVEMPIVAVYSDGWKELIGGNTRLTAMLAQDGKATVWAFRVPDEVAELAENFADGKKPGRKGLAKRMGVNTKASVSDLRKTAKNSSGEKQRMAHWLANMKAGRQKASETIVEFDEEDEIYYSKKLAPVTKKLFQTMYPEAKVKAVEDGDGYLSIETTDGVFGFSIGVSHQYGDNVISVGNAYAGSYKGVVGQLVKAAAELLQKKHPDGETTLVAQHDVSDNYWPQLANKLGINYENNAW